MTVFVCLTEQYVHEWHRILFGTLRKTLTYMSFSPTINKLKTLTKLQLILY